MLRQVGKLSHCALRVCQGLIGLAGKFGDERSGTKRVPGSSSIRQMR
jgi:hypothetical protein